MIHFIIILFGLTMLYVSVTSRLESYIKAIAVQGVILFLLVLFGLILVMCKKNQYRFHMAFLKFSWDLSHV